MQHIIFGDTGGHFNQLYKSLRHIGMTEDYILPHDTRIIHLGDLVHKGLYSSDILRMIDSIRHLNPGQWIQIMGNHEAQYLGGEVFWSKRVDAPGQKILTQWYEEGFLKFIHVLEAESKGFLHIETTSHQYTSSRPIVFSHAGLSLSFWLNNLSQYKVHEYDKAIESTPLVDVHSSGIMMGKNFNPSSPVGPIWAHGVHEVWLMWNTMEQHLFNQIVGHISPYVYERKSYFPGTDESFKNIAELNHEERFTIAPFKKDATVDKSWIGFMDPGFDKKARLDCQPYLIIN